MAGRDTGPGPGQGQNMNQGPYPQAVYSQQPMMPPYGFDGRGMAPPGHMQGYKQPPQQQFGTRLYPVNCAVLLYSIA
jgi:hypothetical protein